VTLVTSALGGILTEHGSIWVRGIMFGGDYVQGIMSVPLALSSALVTICAHIR